MNASRRLVSPFNENEHDDVVRNDAASETSETSETSVRSPRVLKKLLRRNLAIVGVVVVVIGLVAALIAVQTNFDLRQFAWGGVLFNQAGLQGRQMSLADAAKLQRENSESAALFTELTQTYFDADVVNINNPDFQVKGVVFKKYDAALDQTIVYGRLQNLPLLEAVPAMWLEAGVGEYLPAGVGEIVIEDGQPVGYFMTTIEGDTSLYQTMNFSYDASAQQSAPNSIYLSVEFDDPQEGV